MRLRDCPPLSGLTHSRAPALSHTHEGCTPNPRLLLLSLYLAGERAPKERTPRGAGSSLSGCPLVADCFPGSCAGSQGP